MTIVVYLLQVSLGLAFFYAFYYAALRKETLFQTNRMYLIVTLLASIVLPLVRIYILQFRQADIIATPSIMYVGSYLDSISISVTTEKHQIPWTSLLLTVYLSGILLLFLRMMREIYVILRMKRHGEQFDIDHHQCILSKEIESPFSFFNIMYLPSDHQFTDVELAEIIAHEKAHITGGHTIDVLFMELACIALWPSPMIYLYRKKLREVHEFLADAAVLKDTPWENYASFLIAQKVNGLQSRLTNQLIYSQLKNRLKMMTQQRSGFFARFKYLGLVPILLLSLVIFSFREKTKENSDTPVDKHPVYNIYKDGLPVYVVWDSIILTVTKDKRYLLNSIEIPFSKLEPSLKERSHEGLNRRVFLRIDKSLTVGTLADLMQIVQKLNLTMEVDTPIGHASNSGTDSILRASVIVKSGNTILKENDDYQVDYATGKLKIINGAYLHTGIPINVSFNGDTLPTTTIAATGLPQENAEVKLLKNNSGLKPYSNPQEKPRFPGADPQKSLNDFISKTLHYPDKAKQLGIEGTGVVQFVVEADGSISRVKAAYSPNELFNTEMERVIYQMAELPEKWIPGKIEGKAVPVYMNLPIKFDLGPDFKSQTNLNTNSDRAIYHDEIDEMPRYPGCEDLAEDKKSDCATQAMFKYIYESINYPAEDRKKGIEGLVVAKFIVEPDGRVSNPKIVKSVSRGLDAEILRVINGMNTLSPKWIPGRNAGKVVPVELVLPFNFVLQPDQIKSMPSSTADQNKFNVKMNWIRSDTILMFNPGTREDEIIMVSTNPSVVSNNLQVEFSKNVTSASIFNAAGNVMWTKIFKEGEEISQWIDVSAWTSGTYRVKSTSGDQNVFSTFIVQH